MLLSQAQKRNILFLLFIVPLLMGMGVDLYVPSLPAITAYFNTVPHWVQLTIGLYMLGYGVGQFILGVLSDAIGRRSVLLGSAVLYILVSLSAAYSSSIDMLNISRFVQGIGIAGIGVVARAIAMDCFSGLDLTKALTCFSMSWALGPIIGPFVGSYIQHYIDWQGCFYFFAVYGFVVLLYALIAIPETLSGREPIVMKRIACNTIGVCLHPAFILGSFSAALIYSVLIVFNVIGPFLIQTVLHFSVIEYGRIALFLGVAYLLGNISNRLLINRYKPNSIVKISIFLGLIVSVIMLLVSIVSAEMTIFSVIVPVAVLLFLSAFILPNTVSKTVSIFSDLGGTANAVCGTIVALGVFVMTSISSFLKAHNQADLALLYVVMFALCACFYIQMRKSIAKKGLSHEK